MNEQLPLFFDQQEPENLKNFIIYRSSAGSGKTHTLVKEFLKIILMDPLDYQHILAITFTNKAANEMKSRVLDELSLIASGKDSEMKFQIEEEFRRLDTPPNLKLRAEKALDLILHDYGNLGIGTLDHFFTRLVRSLARELNLPLRYDIDVDNQKAIDYAIEKLYEQIDTDITIRNWLAEFTFNRLDNDKNWRIDQNLQQLGLDLFNENFHVGLGADPLPLEEFQKLADELTETSKSFKSTYKSLARKGIKLIESSELEVGDFKRGTVSVFFNVLNDKFEPSATFRKVVHGEDKWYTQKSLKKDSIDNLARNGLDQAASEVLDHYDTLNTKYVSARELLKNIFSYAVMGALSSKLQEYREEYNIVLLADNTFLLRNIIEDKDAPFLFEKIGSKYKHIMIDEFQDTSLYQWRNILPLIKNSISDWNSKVMIVGDIKQSIYRWRGGDMRLLLYGVKDDLAIFQDQIDEKYLENNWRSASQIVEFNNHFFSLAPEILSGLSHLPANQKLIKDAYSKHDQNIQKKKLKGYVEVQWVDSETIDWRESTKIKVLAEIKSCLQDNYNLSDILILVDRTEPGNEMAQFLIKNDIPVITDSALQVQHNQVVQVLINAMKWLSNTDDILARTNLLKLYVSVKNLPFSDNEILLKSNEDIFQKVIPGELLEEISSLQLLPLYELVENLISFLDLGTHTDRFVMRFLDICIEQGMWGRNDIHTFLKWWEENKEDLKVILPDGEDAVEIMTIHKAKGLEKPIVMLPFANYLTTPLSNTIFWSTDLPDTYKKYRLLPFNFVGSLLDSDFVDAYSNELNEGALERLNVVYVAFTRPRERLYIYPEAVKNFKEPKQLNQLIHKVLEDPRSAFIIPDPNSQKYFFGEKVKKAPTQKTFNVEVLKSDNPSGVVSQFKVKDHSNEFWKVSGSDTAKSVRMGLVIHEILSMIDTKEDIGNAVNNAVNSNLISSSEREDYFHRIEEILNSEQVKDLFDPDNLVLSEVDIISNGKKYRPDRVVIKENKATVIDYKTGEIKEAHKEQVGAYRDLLNSMGYEANAVLLYLDDQILDRIEV